MRHRRPVDTAATTDVGHVDGDVIIIQLIYRTLELAAKAAAAADFETHANMQA